MSILIPYSNEHFVKFCEKMLGQPYWYGTCGYNCTESRLQSKAKQYPSHYTASRMATYRKHIAAKLVCADCIGLAKGYAWTDGGQSILDAIGTGKTIASKYASNGCPDRSANGMFSYAKSQGMPWGTIDSLPADVPGIAVRYDGHVGYTMGDGTVVEERGFKYGCVRTKLAGRNWTHWYQLPFIKYGTTNDAPTVEYTLGSRLLKKGMTGADVKAMQELLAQLGYNIGPDGADGDFGANTLSALAAFQQDAGLEVDGLYGDLTHRALMDAVADDDAVNADPEPETETAPETDGAKRVVITSEGGKVNIRVGNGTKYARISSVAPGTALEYIATAANGWHAVVINGQVGWVSGDYAKMEG